MQANLNFYLMSFYFLISEKWKNKEVVFVKKKKK